jgi:hypothetical protein
VNVWRDKAEMLAYWAATRGRKSAEHHRGAGALATGRDVYRVLPGGRMQKSGEFAEINCHRACLDLEIVSHEVTHAALAWCERVRLNPTIDGDGRNVSGEEERFCYAVGHMVNDFAKHLHRRKVWIRTLMSHETFDPDLC